MRYKRLIAAEKGGPEVLKMHKVVLPEPAAGEARVKVLTAGMAFGDIMWLSGKVPGGPKHPFTPGYDLVGIVDQVGEDVSTVHIGQTVAALLPSGGYTEYACLPAEKLVTVSDALDPSEVICLTLNYVTAFQILTRISKLIPGQRVLIHGAAGGVGTAFLQLGKVLSLKMYGTASRAKHELVTDMGGLPIDYKSENFVERIKDLTDGDGVDLVVDHIGGKHFRQSFQTLRDGGRLVATSSLSRIKENSGMFETVAGFMNLPLWNLLPNKKTASLFDIIAFNKKHPSYYSEDLNTLMGYLQEEKIKPVIAGKYSLTEAQQALELLWSGKLVGKLILICHQVYQ